MKTRPILLIAGLIVLSLVAACSPAASTALPQAIEVRPTRASAYSFAPEPTTLPAPVNPNDNFYQDYGVNPEEDPSWDNLSTFAVDVDTASYTVARRYIEGGSLPPYTAVRTEEFVNYFDMQYPSPSETPFALYADGAPSPFGEDGTYLIRFGIQGYRVPDEERLPASLIFVIDVSGSMDMENRLALVKRALTLLVDNLRGDDTIGIVVYGSQARVVLDPTSIENRSRILRVINSLKTDGATNAEAGLKLGYRLALDHMIPGGINRIILCLDGVANVGNTEADSLLEEVKRYVDWGILLTTVGFGMGNFNDTLMEQLADNGNGFYAYVDDIQEARKVFVEDLTSTLQVIALDAKVQVDFNPAVVSEYRLIGYENRDIADEDYFDDSVDGGEIGAGHSVTALYAVKFQPEAWGEIATLYLGWKDPDTQAFSELSTSLYTSELSPSFDAADIHYQLAVTVAQYAELLRESPYTGQSTMRDVSRLAKSVASRLPRDEDVQEFAALVAQAARLKR
jgi:Ca-activated chloride channel family protein